MKVQSEVWRAEMTLSGDHWEVVLVDPEDGLRRAVWKLHVDVDEVTATMEDALQAVPRLWPDLARVCGGEVRAVHCYMVKDGEFEVLVDVHPQH